MQIFIHKGGQQTGPFDESLVLERLKNGDLSPDDMAIRQGDAQWQPLRALYPSTQPQASAAPSFPVTAPSSFGVPDRPAAVGELHAAPLFRKTVFQKIFFGLAFLAAAAAFVAALVYMQSMSGSSGDLLADVQNMSRRIWARDTTIALFVTSVFALLAFLLTFKRKIIRSNGLRIAMRVVFAFILLSGLAYFIFGSVSYLNYRTPYRPKADASNEMLKALNDGEDAIGPLAIATFHLPIATGIILLGLSGILMTKRGRKDIV